MADSRLYMREFTGAQPRMRFRTVAGEQIPNESRGKPDHRADAERPFPAVVHDHPCDQGRRQPCAGADSGENDAVGEPTRSRTGIQPDTGGCRPIHHRFACAEQNRTPMRSANTPANAESVVNTLDHTIPSAIYQARANGSARRPPGA